jgi:Domain of unknown function (DUF4365)
MSFYDFPKIDKNAERSEESVIKTREIFSKKNGFISREVGVDDYGVDIFSELKVDQGASLYNFPIQIKSTKRAQFIFKDGVKILKLPFSTSRLGYLHRHTNLSAIIVLYEESNNLLFYQFAYDVINQILTEQKDDKWKDQQTVRVSFDSNNTLDKESIGYIFNRIYTTITKINEIIRNHFSQIDLNFPLLDKRQFEPEPNKISKMVQYLLESGNILFNDRKYTELIELIEQLPKKEADRPPISYLAALVYTENGNILSADYYLKIASHNKKYFTEEGWEALQLQQLKFDFNYSSLSVDEIIEKINEIKPTLKSEDNIRHLEIALIQSELKKMIGFDINDDLYEKSIDFMNLIGNVDNDNDQKHFQTVFHSENLINLIFLKFSSLLNDRLLYKYSFSSFESNNEKQINILHKTLHNIIQRLNQAVEFSIQHENILLYAHAIMRIADLNYKQFLNYYLANYKPIGQEKIKTTLSEVLEYQLEAYSLYLDHSLMTEASYTINCAYETHRLAKVWLNFDLDKSHSIDKIKKEVNKHKGQSYNRLFTNIIDHFDERKNNKLEDNAPLDQKSIEMMTNKAIEMFNLPKERAINIINEIKSTDYFKLNCNNKDLEILTSNPDPSFDQNAYKYPTKYCIRNKKTNLIYSEGYDIVAMMNKIGL